MADAQIGRFELVKQLGKGAQGTVWLARDPVLNRDVALKLLAASEAGNLGEAQMVSQLQHPNVVQLFDIIEHQGRPALVFEYVPGVTLRDKLAVAGKLPGMEVAKLLRDVLSGLGAAHAKGILHRDVKPANVMLDKEGRARLMDFGVAALPEKAAAEGGFSGTLSYMAPEYVTGEAPGVAADLFSVGVLGYELVTGRNPLSGDTPFQVMYKIANVPIELPSKLVSGVDPRLEHVLMVALNKHPDERYKSAAEMQAAFDALLTQGEGDVAEGDAAAAQATLEFLLRRMRVSADFPALSQSITSINKLVGSDAESIHKLAETILRDFSLTNKLLRLVNSAVYGQFGGISTISRAVMILGFDTVRNLAISLILFEHMQNRAQASSLKDQMLVSFLGGMLARGVGKRLKLKGMEEAFIGGLFYHLGKMLAAYYFHEEFVDIQRRVQQGTPEAQAASQVLGLDFNRLGTEIAAQWHFPQRLLSAMEPMSGKAAAPKTDVDRLRLVTTFSGELTQLAAAAQPDERDKKLSELAQKYGDATGLTERESLEVLKTGLEELVRDAPYFGVDPRGDALARLKGFAGGERRKQDAAGAPVVIDTLERASREAMAAQVEDMTADRTDAQAVLTAGVQDITNTLVGDYNLNDLMNMILETMYRGLGFQRVLFFLRDPRSQRMLCRFGYGNGVDKLVKQMILPLDGPPQVFQLCLLKNLDIQIDDATAPNIADRIPDWYRKQVGALAFVLLPVVVDKKPLGLFYADQAQPNTLNLDTKLLTLMKTLRNQAVLAIRQKQM